MIVYVPEKLLFILCISSELFVEGICNAFWTLVKVLAIPSEIDRFVMAIWYFLACGKAYENCSVRVQNFLYTTKEENAKLKVIDFGLSDFVRPGEIEEILNPLLSS